VPPETFVSLEALASERLREEMIFLAQKESELLGFIHLGIVRPDLAGDIPPGEPAAIRFLTYPVGAREAGVRLLEAAEKYARAYARNELIAWHHYTRYPFYHCPWGQLSGRMAHIRALLGMYGYEDAGDSELYFHWHDFVPPQPEVPALPCQLIPEWTTGKLGTRLVLKAVQEGEELGVCLMDRGQTSPSSEAQDWCYCDLLDVKEQYQGQRLGNYLLASALQEMKRAGCKHAAISTTWNNYRAALFYTNLGFQFADQTYSFKKILG
jgi:GNAT superfamily N-acetyltransferase